MKYLVSLSGGKDSTALLHWTLQRRSKLDIVPFYIDTEWEHPSTYEYLDYLDELFDIKIVRLKNKMGFEELCKHEKMIPSFHAKFCTRILKMERSNDFVNSFDESVVVMTGVRRDESEKRKDEQSHKVVNGIKYIQPLAYWSTQEVYDYLTINSIKLNPLYLKGFSRVGCYPCIFANQKDIGALEQWAVDKVVKLENDVSEIADIKVTFFKDMKMETKKSKAYNSLGLDLGCINPYGACGT